MKAPAFGYLRPASVAQALQMLGTTENARILAGGQSLMAMLNMRFAFPDWLIDVNRVADLAFIREEEQAIVFGAMTRQREVEFSDLVARRLPLLREAILNVGHRQTRNRGTVGGSLCQLDPSAEIPTIAMAMDATVTVASVRGERHIAMADFPAGYMAPAMEPDEMLVRVAFQPWAPTHGHAFLEFSRRHGDFAIVSSAVLLQRGADGLVERASITLGGVASAPLRMVAAEQALLQTRADARDIAHAAELCSAIDATADSYVPAWYRQRLARVLTRRALTTALERAAR